MKSTLKIFALIGVLILSIVGCSVEWTKAIRKGSLGIESFRDTVALEIQKKLIIVPVSINNKKYRFLFDTGAPFSISNQLQREHTFKIISKGNIVDSDHNRTKVKWAQVDSIHIGDVSFLNQTAFIGDFETNQVMKCLKVDGIIGSNLIRHCNWKIDQEEKLLSLFTSTEIGDIEQYVSLPFKTDYQYNIFVDLGFGQSVVKNVLVDYGSNGSIALSKNIFSTLQSRDVLEVPFVEKGIKQSGIIGVPVVLNRKITYSDSLRLGALELKNVLIKTGETTSLGNLLLSRFKVVVDWKSKHLHFHIPEVEVERPGIAGFGIGYSPEKGFYIQSVVEESNAFKQGIRANMKVVKIDDLDFERDYDFCDYIRYKMGNEVSIHSIDSIGVERVHRFTKTY